MQELRFQTPLALCYRLTIIKAGTGIGIAIAYLKEKLKLKLKIRNASKRKLL